jgi:hypothetical protein
MLKYLLLTLIIANSSCVLYGGNALRRKQQSITITQITEEIQYLLQTIYTNDCQNRRQLQIRIVEAMEKRLTDSKTFPLFNNLTKEESFRNNRNLQNRLGQLLHSTTLHFLNKKFPEPKQQSNEGTIIEMTQSID